MIAIHIDDHGMSVNLANAKKVTGLILQKWMTRVVNHVQAAVGSNIGDGGLLGRRTGTLARSLTTAVTLNDDGSCVGEVWPDPTKAPYGTIQEEGGTVYPKNAAHLTIPLAAMLTGNGVARGTARDLIANPKAFGYQSTFLSKAKTAIMGSLGKGQAPVPLFALASSVTIPAHHYLATTLTQETTWIASELERVAGEDVGVYFGDGEVAA